MVMQAYPAPVIISAATAIRFRHSPAHLCCCCCCCCCCCGSHAAVFTAMTTNRYASRNCIHSRLAYARCFRMQGFFTHAWLASTTHSQYACMHYACCMHLPCTPPLSAASMLLCRAQSSSTGINQYCCSLHLPRPARCCCILPYITLPPCWRRTLRCYACATSRAACAYQQKSHLHTCGCSNIY
jgi:hypothetical protein